MEAVLVAYQDMITNALAVPRNGYLSVLPRQVDYLTAFRREVESFLTGGTGKFLPERVLRLQQQGFDIEDDQCPEMGSVIWLVKTPRGRVLFR